MVIVLPMVYFIRILLSRSSCSTTSSSCFAMDAIPGHLTALFETAIVSVLPHRLIYDHVQRIGDTVLVNGTKYELDQNCYVVGFGKAVLGMAAALERELKEHLVSGIISVPIGIRDMCSDKPLMMLGQDTKIEVMEGAKNNIPDSHALSAANMIKNMVENLEENSLLFVLISGGGSALLPCPLDSISLTEKSSLIQELAKRGADIFELNSVRKCLSKLKGGGLATAAYPSQIIALILSDVIGDSLETIASGPTCVNTEYMSAYDILAKYKLSETISDNLRSNLTRSEARNIKITITGGNFDHVNNILIGNNRVALQAAFDKADELGYIPIIVRSDTEGLARDIGKDLAGDAIKLCKRLSGMNSLPLSFETYMFQEVQKLSDAIRKCKESKGGLCLIFGGETTVLVQGTGIGGRNQEMALSFALHLYKEAPASIKSKFSICLLSAGTDGIDGPTDAAGAIAYAGQITATSQQDLDAEQYLDNNDSNTFYSRIEGGKYLVKTGHTGTNVMDLQILIIKPL